jgi:HK97 family phage prohead protease
VRGRYERIGGVDCIICDPRVRYEDKKRPVIEGQAVRWDEYTSSVESWDKQSVCYQFMPGCFQGSIKKAEESRETGETEYDVVFCRNHDRRDVIARTMNGSLMLSENTRGLWVEAMPCEGRETDELLAKIKGGYLRHLSLGFRADDYHDVFVSGSLVRQIFKATIRDVALVAKPSADTWCRVREKVVGTVAIQPRRRLL